MRSREKCSYQTLAEIAFIKDIGTHAKQARTMPRKLLLKGYLAGAEKRTRWDGINASCVCLFAMHELVVEEIETGQ